MKQNPKIWTNHRALLRSASPENIKILDQMESYQDASVHLTYSWAKESINSRSNQLAPRNSGGLAEIHSFGGEIMLSLYK